MEEKMKGTKHIFGLGLLVLALFTACGNVLDSNPATNNLRKDGLVRIYLGEQSSGARTVQPGQDALSGYRLTFVCDSDSDIEREPVDITGANYADVYLNDGTWTITAKAYKLGGTIGGESDKIAEGSITVTLDEGAVEGAVSPIILRSSAVGTGTLHYDITIPTGVTGYLKLWNSNDIAVSGFGTNGVLTFAASFTGDYTLAAGRYIAEASLTNHTGGGVGFRREVVEIWADTVSDFIFAPAEFLDSNWGLMEEGVYVGVISFDEHVRELTTNGPVLLDAAGVSNLNNILDSDYKRADDIGTGLYYGVHKALADLTSQELILPFSLERVYIITFTDGLDQSSYGLSRNNPIEGKQGMGIENYRSYLIDEIENREIKKKDIVAYSMGVMGSDIDKEAPDAEENFLKTISSIASTGTASDGNPYYTKLTDWDDLEDRFKAISKGLDIKHSNVTFNLTIPYYEPGTKVRITFDVQKAGATTAQGAASQKYLEGTFSEIGDDVFLTEITYKGTNTDGEPLGSSAGTGPIIGTPSGSSKVSFLFDGLTGFKTSDPSDPADPLAQWYITPGQSSWQVNSEYIPDDDMATLVERRSAIIYLVLDSSTSLDEDNVNSIRTAAKSFIDMITPSSEGEQAQTYTVTVANTITGGTVSATPTSGTSGTIVYLSNTPDSSYIFDHYTVNGTAISGNSFILNGNVVVGAVFIPRISNIYYSGDSWTLEADGRYRSPAVGHSQTTICRVGFTSTGYNNQLVIALDVSSELDYDFAYVSVLDSTTYIFDNISGSLSKPITIPVPNPGDHFVEIGYVKDNIQSSGSDCAWFKIVN
jgi:hypothetical protein